MIELTPVNSSLVKARGYDPETRTLALEFSSGVWHFQNVPPEVYAEMTSDGQSIGSYYHQNIRGAFESEKFSLEEE